MGGILLNGLTLAEQVCILFVLIGIGAVASKTKLISDDGAGSIINLLLYVVTPAIVINSFLSVKFTAETIRNLAVVAGCAAVTHLLGILFSLIYNTEPDKERRSVLKFGTVFSNGGFMAIPLAEALYGSEGVLYCSIYVIVFNFFQWTYGIAQFSAKSSVLKMLVNPGTVGVAIGLPLFLLKLTVPDIIGVPLDYLSGLNTPLAMLVSGYYLAHADLKHGIGSPQLWLYTAGRLLIVPVAALVIFRFGFSLSGTLLNTCIITASAPCAIGTVIMAVKFGGDRNLALRMLAVSTLLSVITMPLLLSLAQYNF